MHKVPLKEKIFFTILLLILIPAYWKNYGLENFLWISDISLFLTYLALIFQNRLLMSIPTLGSLPVEFLWIFEFTCQLLTGNNFTTLAQYMFEPQYNILLKALSLFHLILPIVWIKYLFTWGYDKRALPYMTILALSLGVATYLLTNPEKNINWVFSPELYNWHWISNPLWLLLFLTIIPITIFLPMHFLLKRFFSNKKNFIKS